MIFYYYQYLAQSSSEMLPPANGKKDRDPQTDIMERVRYLGTLSPKWNVSTKSFYD